jgi:hypothetical protein
MRSLLLSTGSRLPVLVGPYNVVKLLGAFILIQVIGDHTGGSSVKWYLLAAFIMRFSLQIGCFVADRSQPCEERVRTWN